MLPSESATTPSETPSPRSPYYVGDAQQEFTRSSSSPHQQAAAGKKQKSTRVSAGRQLQEYYAAVEEDNELGQRVTGPFVGGNRTLSSKQLTGSQEVAPPEQYIDAESTLDGRGDVLPIYQQFYRQGAPCEVIFVPVVHGRLCRTTSPPPPPVVPASKSQGSPSKKRIPQ